MTSSIYVSDIAETRRISSDGELHNELALFGKDQAGDTMTVFVQNQKHYIYLLVPPGFSRISTLQDELNQACLASNRYARCNRTGCNQNFASKRSRAT